MQSFMSDVRWLITANNMPSQAFFDETKAEERARVLRREHWFNVQVTKQIQWKPGRWISEEMAALAS